MTIVVQNPKDKMDEIMEDLASENIDLIIPAVGRVTSMRFEDIPLSKVSPLLDTMEETCANAFKGSNKSFNRENIQTLDIMYGFYYDLLKYAKEVGVYVQR